MSGKCWYFDLHWQIRHSWSLEIKICSHRETWAPPNSILGRQPIMMYIQRQMQAMNTQSFPKICIYILKGLEGSPLTSHGGCWRFQFRKALEHMLKFDSGVYLTRSWIPYWSGKYLKFSPHLKSCHSHIFHCCHHSERLSGLWRWTDEFWSTNGSPQAGNDVTWTRSDVHLRTRAHPLKV